MRKRRTLGYRVTMLAVLAACCSSGCAKENTPALPPGVVKSWTDVGGEVGWWRAQRDSNPYNPPQFLFVPSGRQDGGAAGDLPAFVLGTWHDTSKAALTKLPDAGVPFGLFLGPQADDSDLKDLAGLKNLCALDLSRSPKVTDAGVKELARLENMQTLNLSYTQVTDVGLKELAALKSLQTLDLRDTKITDAGMKELARLTSLRVLYLVNSRGVTDTGLRELSGMNALQELNVFGTETTEGGVAALRKDIPGCKIVRY